MVEVSFDDRSPDHWRGFVVLYQQTYIGAPEGGDTENGVVGESNRQFARPDLDEQSLELVFEIIQNNTTVPLVIADNKDTIYFHRNIDLPQKNQSAFLQQELRQMKQGREPIVIDLGNGQKQYLYYADSIILRKLRWFPVVQLFVVIVFVLLAYWAFSAARRWEQDQVWVAWPRKQLIS